MPSITDIYKKQAGPKKKTKSKKSRVSARNRTKSAGLGWVFMLCLLLSIFTAGYLNLDQVDKLISKVEVNFLNPALAAAEKASVEGLKGEDSAKASAGAKEDQCNEKESYTDEEISHFSKLNDRKKALDMREQELNALEEELHNQRTEIESRISRLQNIRREISSVLNDRVAVDEERVKTLVDFYSNMKPKKAADIFNGLNEDLAIEVLGRMKKKNAAEIMNLLDPRKAKVLSEKYTGYKRR